MSWFVASQGQPRPVSIPDPRQVLAVFINVLLVLNEPGLESLLQGQWTGLRFTVTNATGHDEIGSVEHGPERMAEGLGRLINVGLL